MKVCKTLCIDDRNYQIGALTFGQGKELFGGGTPSSDVNTPLLRYSLNNADGGTRTDAEIDEIPYSHAMQIISAALDVNGLVKPKAAQPGEDQPVKDTE